MAKKDQENKRKKFIDFKNQPQQADLTQAIFEKKEMQNNFDKTRPERMTLAKKKKKDKKNTIASKIIKRRVYFNLYINIMRKYNLH